MDLWSLDRRILREAVEKLLGPVRRVFLGTGLWATAIMSDGREVDVSSRAIRQVLTWSKGIGWTVDK